MKKKLSQSEIENQLWKIRLLIDSGNFGPGKSLDDPKLTALISERDHLLSLQNNSNL